MEAVLPITQMPETIIAATKHGLITPDNALNIAASMEDMAKRGVVYAWLLALDILDDEQADFAREQALAMALEIGGGLDTKRGDIIETLVPYLQESDFADVIPLIMKIGSTITRSQTLGAFALHLDDGWRRQLFRVAMAHPDNSGSHKPRHRRLISIVPFVSESERWRIFEYIMQLQILETDMDDNRYGVLITLAPHADARLRQQIYENYHRVSDDEYNRPISLLIALLHSAEDSEKDHYISVLMTHLLNLPQNPNALPSLAWLPNATTADVLRVITTRYVRDYGSGFLHHLTKMQLDALVHLVLIAPVPRDRCAALAQLAFYVDMGLQRLVIEEGLSMIPQLQGLTDLETDDEIRAKSLARFAPYVNDNTRVRYLRIARSLASRERSNPLRELAIHTDDETEKNALLEEAWDAALNLPTATFSFAKKNHDTELVSLIPHLNTALYDKTLEYVLHSPILGGYDTNSMQDELYNTKQQQQQSFLELRISLLEALAPYLNPEQLKMILDATDIENL